MIRKKGTLYAEISTPAPDSEDSDSDSDISDDGIDLSFSKTQQKQLRKIISSSVMDVIGDALNPSPSGSIGSRADWTGLIRIFFPKDDNLG